MLKGNKEMTKHLQRQLTRIECQWIFFRCSGAWPEGGPGVSVTPPPPPPPPLCEQRTNLLTQVAKKCESEEPTCPTFFLVLGSYILPFKDHVSTLGVTHSVTPPPPPPPLRKIIATPLWLTIFCVGIFW